MNVFTPAGCVAPAFFVLASVRDGIGALFAFMVIAVAVGGTLLRRRPR